jgi:hypothetical protein
VLQVQLQGIGVKLSRAEGEGDDERRFLRVRLPDVGKGQEEPVVSTLGDVKGRHGQVRDAESLVQVHHDPRTHRVFLEGVQAAVGAEAEDERKAILVTNSDKERRVGDGNGRHLVSDELRGLLEEDHSGVGVSTGLMAISGVPLLDRAGRCEDELECARGGTEVGGLAHAVLYSFGFGELDEHSRTLSSRDSQVPRYLSIEEASIT